MLKYAKRRFGFLDSNIYSWIHKKVVSTFLEPGITWVYANLPQRRQKYYWMIPIAKASLETLLRLFYIQHTSTSANAINFQLRYWNFVFSFELWWHSYPSI